MRKEILLNDDWRFHKGDIEVKRGIDKGPMYSQSKTERRQIGPAAYCYNDTPDPYNHTHIMRKIAFIGVGNMANAIIGGLLRSGAVDCPHLILSDKFPDKCGDYVAGGATLAASPAEAAAQADCIVLSVKPQNFPEILPELAAVGGIDQKLIITIAAGISSDSVRNALHGAPTVRVLPNTPMLVGLGVSLICTAPAVAVEDFDFVRSMFEASNSIIFLEKAISTEFSRSAVSADSQTATTSQETPPRVQNNN